MNIAEFILSRIAEEASEIAQAAIKCQRFTTDHAHYKESNVDRLKGELGDLEGLVRMAGQLGIFVIDPRTQEKHIERRVEKELHYMQISHDMGCIDDLSKMNPCHTCKHKDSIQEDNAHCFYFHHAPKSLCTSFAQK